jgi:AcrR family transcriptional regulator
MELLLSYRPPPEPLRLATRPPTPAPETIDAHDHSERALRAFAVVAAEEGYANTRINQVVKRASMSPTTFYSIFDGKEDLLMAAIESAGAQLAAAVLPAFRRSTDWPQGVRAAFGALFSFLASRPALAQLVIVETYAAGPEAVEHREATLRSLEAILAEGRARSPEVSPLSLEAIVGGIYRLAYKQIRQSGAESLPSLAPVCTYLTLAPFIGAEQACTAANGDGRGKGARGPDMPYRQMLSRTLALLKERQASVADISQQIDAPIERVRRIVEELKAADLLEEAEERGLADADGILYRTSPVLLEDERWAQLSLAERQEISTGISHLITAEIDQALEAGTFDARIDRYLTHTPVRVDEQGWQELMAIHDEAFRASREAQERSAKRLERDGKAGIDGRSVQVLFEMPEP